MKIKSFNKNVQLPYLQKELSARNISFGDNEILTALKDKLKRALNAKDCDHIFELIGEGNNAGVIESLGRQKRGNKK